MSSKHLYRVRFMSGDKLYELYAREVGQSSMYAFVEVAHIIFGERSKLVVDPSEEQLKAQFSGVKRTYIPLHSLIRIDEVDKEGQNKILAAGDDAGKVTPFPLPVSPPSGSD